MESTAYYVAAIGFVVGISAGNAGAQDPPVNALLVGQLDEYAGAYGDLWSEGDYVYMGQSSGDRARVQIISIADPTAPFLVSTFAFSAPNQYAAPQDVHVADDLLFVGLEYDSQDGAAIIDVRDPTALVQVATIDVYDDVHTLTYDRGYLFMADGRTSTVGIVDLTNFDPDDPPPSPIEASKWFLTGVGSNFVHEVTAKDGRLYCAAWDSGLWVYDIADIVNLPPVFLGSIDGQSTHTAWPTDDGRYVATAEERPVGHLNIYRMEDESGSLSFSLTDSWVLSESGYCIHQPVFIGNRLYCAWYGAGLQVFDLDPTTGLLSLRSSYDTSAYDADGGYVGAWGVFPYLGTDKVLVSDMQNGLQVVAMLPDDCTPIEDCNANGQADSCDAIMGTSPDCNRTLRPDECEVVDGSSLDCQPNGVPDECEEDCNANTIPDDCDMAGGASQDCNVSGVLDECELTEILILETELVTASDAAANDSFGCSVSVHGDLAAIGACEDTHSNQTDAGSAYLFRLAGDDWLEEAKLTASDAASYDNFGWSVSISEDLVIVGAYGDSHAGGSSAGSVYVFRFDGEQWIEEAKLTACDADNSDYLGWSVSVSEDLAVAGAKGANSDQGDDVGAAYAFRFVGGRWIEEAKLTPSDGAASDTFGTVVAASGDLVVAGSPSDDHSGRTSAGSAYVFRFDGTAWTEEAKLTASDPASHDTFGWSVSVAGDTIMIGAPSDTHPWVDEAGSAYVFRFDGLTWVEEAKLTASDGMSDDAFGWSVSVSEDLALVGAAFDDSDLYEDSGSVYAFSLNEGVWVETLLLLSSVPGPEDAFGSSVFLAGGHSIVGAPEDDLVAGSGSGSAHLSWLLSTDCNDNGILDDCDIQGGTSTDSDIDGVPDECEALLPCAGDANADDTVDPLDAGFVQSRFGCVVSTGDPDCDAADQNGDGVVDPLDSGFVLSRFGECS